MATYNTNLSPSNSSDAYFRAWGSAVSAQLAAMGLVQTADTGQIDWLTVTAAGVANTAAGYEVWRFNDALQATSPVFVLVEYGAGNAVNNPSIWITVSNASDGAGALTGVTSTRTQLRSTASSTTAYSSYFSGSTNRFHCILFSNGASTLPIFFSLERTKDSTGNDTGDGVLILMSGAAGGSGWNQQYYQIGTGPTTIETTWGVLMPSVGTGSSGSNVAIYPVFLTNGVFLNPPLGALCAFNANVTGGTSIAITIYGSSHTFYVIGSTVSAMQRGTIANPATVLMRYE